MEVSEVGLGCNNFGMRIDLEATCKVVAKALELGVTFFDTADVYVWASRNSFSHRRSVFNATT